MSVSARLTLLLLPSPTPRRVVRNRWILGANILYSPWRLSFYFIPIDDDLAICQNGRLLTPAASIPPPHPPSFAVWCVCDVAPANLLYSIFRQTLNVGPLILPVLQSNNFDSARNPKLQSRRIRLQRLNRKIQYINGLDSLLFFE